MEQFPVSIPAEKADDSGGRYVPRTSGDASSSVVLTERPAAVLTERPAAVFTERPPVVLTTNTGERLRCSPPSRRTNIN